MEKQRNNLILELVCAMIKSTEQMFLKEGGCMIGKEKVH